MSELDLQEVMSKPEYQYPGLEGCLTSLKWLWESRFAAVAGDNPGFEAWSKSSPCHTHLIALHPYSHSHAHPQNALSPRLLQRSRTDCAYFAPGAGLGDSADKDSMRMHEYILSGFGLPIGELFDLEALAAECERQSRWTFFVTSEPLNLVGGVGSPPNALAIF
jgi:hypothetical protein